MALALALEVVLSRFAVKQSVALELTEILSGNCDTVGDSAVTPLSDLDFGCPERPSAMFRRLSNFREQARLP
ncbi:hypothetical protein A5724_13420 [Mycobacterium sp. ACS1612]|uniref:hypothetical protein n=1 Tax=Mycobacterium sp. ACS1612 TaxID=1834117 RepID=UPI0007FDB025|nr:hypothetical protein [Mycobacterium sp. ACS1612]OBF36201.1 hypothetical protein A5724_13420 [Mycobacterium sp. ACS1612]